MQGTCTQLIVLVREHGKRSRELQQVIRESDWSDATWLKVQEVNIEKVRRSLEEEVERTILTIDETIIAFQGLKKYNNSTPTTSEIRMESGASAQSSRALRDELFKKSKFYFGLFHMGGSSPSSKVFCAIF